jgi:NADH-quinone oxidoreductase subunit H
MDLEHGRHQGKEESFAVSFEALLFFRILIFPGFLFLFFFALFCDWFERKLMARMQNRMGPSYTGPFGILQPLADYIKLLTKEDIIPEHAEKLLFVLTPFFSFSIFMLSVFYFPIDGLNVFFDVGFEGDLVFVLALVTFAHFALFLSGWASRNIYCGIGAVRILTQFIGYDVPLLILAIGPAFVAGSLSLTKIASIQNIPFALLIPWVFAPFLLALQAELEEDPFDIPHAETEIVAGYGTEFSGRKFAFIRLSKDIQIVFGAVLTVTLFLGGPYGPVFFGQPSIWFTVWFVIKTLLVISIFEFVEAVCARLRIDYVVKANWRFMIPLAILCVALTVFCMPFIQSLMVVV